MLVLETQSGEIAFGVEKPKRRSRRKLFISYRGIIIRMVDHKVEAPDLRAGLFYFGCIRKTAFDLRNLDMQKLIPDQTEANDVHQRLVAALELAEAEGRAAWRTTAHPSSFEQLSDLLRQNGYRQVMPPNGKYFGPSTYAMVKDLVQHVNPTLQVIF
jgi:hypothetical protein